MNSVISSELKLDLIIFAEIQQNLLPGLSNEPATEQSASSLMLGMQLTPEPAEFKLLVDLLPVMAAIRFCALRGGPPQGSNWPLSGSHAQMKLLRIRD